MARIVLRAVRSPDDVSRAQAFVATPGFSALDETGRRAALHALVPMHDGAAARGAQALNAVLDPPMAPAARAATLTVAATALAAGDAPLATAVQALLSAPAFTALPDEARASVLAGLMRNPTAETARALTSVCGQAWFTGMDGNDQRRAVRTVETLSRTADASQDPRRTVLRNTLGRITAGEIALAFENLPGSVNGDRRPDPGCCGGGPHRHSTIRIDEVAIPSDDAVHETLSTAAEERLFRTLPHEASHHTNDDGVAASYDYFMSEYRAEYVGEIGLHGTPSPSWMLDWAHNLVAGRDGGLPTYPDIARAAADFSGPSASGPRILRFINQFLPAAQRLPETPEGMARFIAASTDSRIGLQWEQPRDTLLPPAWITPFQAVRPDTSGRGSDLDN
jgi:hypothetical protein